MASIRAGLLANYTGRLLGFLIVVVATPLQIRYLGIPAYGVVGLAMALQSLVSLFDFGMSATVHREVARRSGVPALEGQSVRVVRELERVYWGLALTIGVALIVAAPLIATNWLRSTMADELTLPLALAGLAIAVHLPIGFYAAGLTALQRQATVNVLYVVTTLLKFGGSVVVSAASSGSLRYFFAWMVLASLVSVVAYRVAFALALPPQSGEALPLEDRRTMWRFTMGVSAVSIGLLLMSQADKLLVSRLIAVEDFAFYSLAGTVVGGLYLLYQPVVTTFAPKLTQAFGAGDAHQTSFLYHASSQILGATVFPAAIVVAVFSPEVLFLWTRSAAITEASGPLVRALMPGALFGAAVYMPYCLLRAAGWTSMPSAVLFATLIGFVPAMSVAVSLRGALGAAVLWSIAVAVQSAIVVVLLHRRLLRGELADWLKSDVAPPFVAAVIACLAVKVATPPATSVAAMAGVVGLASIASLAASVLATETPRSHVLGMLRRGRTPVRAAVIDNPPH